MATIDICILAVAVDPTDTDTHNKGDINRVGRQSDSVCRHERFVMVKVNKVPSYMPDDLMLQQVSNVLTESVNINEGMDTEKVIRERMWFIDYSMATQEELEILSETREITVTWDRIKPMIFRRDVQDDNDPSKDNFIPIQDGDL